MRKMSWTGRMPLPGASASTTQMGGPIPSRRDTGSPAPMIPDFTNPAAEETWFSKRNYLTEMGIDGFKTDGGEFIYREDVRFADGSSGRAGKNRYAQEYTAAYTKHLGSAQALFSRAGYAGQHTTPIHWAGD